jgi:type II secretory pathway pseudopilin PulG
MKRPQRSPKESTLNSKSYTLNPARRGFTIAELLIAMGLFVTVVGIVSGVFIQNLRSVRVSVALANANANASIVLEQMSRDLRTGTGFDSPNPDEVSFTNSTGDTVTYHLDTANKAIERSLNGGTFVPITATDVGVLSLNFILLCNPSSGCDPTTDGYPPRITIVVRVTPTTVAALNLPIINLQTTVSARDLDG